MIKEVVIGAVVVSVFWALKNYLLKTDDSKKERDFIDNVTIAEIKEWFGEDMKKDGCVGMLFIPTAEVIQKYNLSKIYKATNKNILVQAVWKEDGEEIVRYREINYNLLSEGVVNLLQDNEGIVILEP